LLTAISDEQNLSTKPTTDLSRFSIQTLVIEVTRKSRFVLKIWDYDQELKEK
jgi:hypothetical protein